MDCNKCVVSVGRSGSKWIEKVCQDLDIPTKSNRVDIGVRVELLLVSSKDQKNLFSRTIKNR